MLITVLAAFLFGMYPAASRLAYREGANAACIMLSTTAARALGLYFCCALQRRPVWSGPIRWKPTVTGGALQACSLVGVLASLVTLPGPITIIILFTHTLMLLLFLAVRGEQQLTPLALGTTVAALAGLACVLRVWDYSSGLDPRGLALAFFAAVATMQRLYVYGKETVTVDPAVVGARAFLIAFVCICGVCFFQPPLFPFTPAGLWGVAVACLSLSTGTIGMFYGIAYLGSFQYSLMVKLEPVFTAFFSIVVLGEILQPVQYAGMAVVLSSLLAYQFWNRARQELSGAPIRAESEAPVRR